MANVENGKKVSFDYTLTVDGEVVDTSKGKQPLEYTHGEPGLIPGLTSRMEGMEEGEERKIKVPSEEGYGPVDPKAFQEVPKTQLPENTDPKVGMLFQAQSPDGSMLPVKVTEVKNTSVIIDFNHPLAGKDLDFEVKVVSVS